MILYSNGCTNCERLKAQLDLSKIEYQVSSDYRRLLELNIRSAPCLEFEDGTILLYNEAMVYAITRRGVDNER
jgi:hypothetical protein